ncbi:MAG: tRNA dihydrouridine synthase DusB [Ardenticatenaceae bacterium]|nr:tRNA dihydrouridine synthase DusB [Ardenticatenaceae bacterium]
MSKTATFLVRDIPIHGDLILAPMDGYSDMPFRLICREMGSAMSYTEFVNVDELQSRKWPEKTARKLIFDPSEQPMTFQIYGSDEDRLVETAERMLELGPSILDLNMGCSVKSIAGRGAGAGLLSTPDKIGRIFRRLTAALPVPVTGKIRLGWDDQNRNFLDVARILEDNGAALIAVHGRTKEQRYKGSADWDAIAAIKQAVNVPVIGNGDVTIVDDIARIKAHTGCDGVMIARGAIGNPWIFARKEPHQVTFKEKAALVRRHLALNLDFYGQELGLILFRKHIVKYIESIRTLADFRMRLLTCTEVEQFVALIAEAEVQRELGVAA